MNEPITYDFNAKLIASDGHCSNANIESILLSNIAGSLNVKRAHEANDRSGVDWWVECKGCRHLAIDAKVREVDYARKGQDDLALETWSVVEASKVGWTLDDAKQCDFVLWLWKDTGRWCMVPFAMLCQVFTENIEAWKSTFKVARQRTPTRDGRGYHSEVVFVPRREVWKAIYGVYGGQPK